MEVLFRAVDKQGRTVDFLLTHRRNAKAARRFLAKALRSRQNWPPHVINTDKNPAYGEALRQLKRDDPDAEIIEHRQVKYLNNRIEARSRRTGVAAADCYSGPTSSDADLPARPIRGLCR